MLRLEEFYFELDVIILQMVYFNGNTKKQERLNPLDYEVKLFRNELLERRMSSRLKKE